MRLEADSQSGLEAPTESRHARRIAKIRIAARTDEVFQAAVVGPVERIEHFADHSNIGSADESELLLQTEVEAESLREVENVERRTGAE